MFSRNFNKTPSLFARVESWCNQNQQNLQNKFFFCCINPNVYISKAYKHICMINACKTKCTWQVTVLSIGLKLSHTDPRPSLLLTPEKHNRNWLKTLAHIAMNQLSYVNVVSHSNWQQQWSNCPLKPWTIKAMHKSEDTCYQIMCILKTAQRKSGEITKHKRLMGSWYSAVSSEMKRLKAAIAEMHQLCTT